MVPDNESGMMMPSGKASIPATKGADATRGARSSFLSRLVAHFVKIRRELDFALDRAAIRSQRDGDCRDNRSVHAQEVVSGWHVFNLDGEVSPAIAPPVLRLALGARQDARVREAHLKPRIPDLGR